MTAPERPRPPRTQWQLENERSQAEVKRALERRITNLKLQEIEAIEHVRDRLDALSKYLPGPWPNDR